MPTTVCKLRIGVSGYCTAPEALVFRGGRWRQAHFPCSWALIEHPAVGLILFDTGYAPRFLEATQTFPERLYRWVTPVHLAPGHSAVEQLIRWGYHPSDVRIVVLSHLHGDHLAGLADFSNSALLVHPGAASAYRSLGRFQRVKEAFLQELLPLDFESRLLPFAPRGRLTEWEGLTLVDLPGHAPGHLGLLVETASGPVLLAADSAWCEEELMQITRVHPVAGRILQDQRLYHQSQDWIRHYLRIQTNARVVLSHGSDSHDWAALGWI